MSGQPDRFLPRDAVLARLGIKTSKLYKMMADGEFPRPVKIGTRSVWSERVVERWMARRMGVTA